MPYFYDSIHNIPVGVFFQISESNDLTKLSDRKHPANRLAEAWAKINQEILDLQGIPATYSTVLKFKIRALLEYEKAYIHGQRFSRTLAAIETAKAQEAQEGQEAGDFMRTIAQLSKFMGFRVDPMSTTLYEYFSYIRLSTAGK